MENAREGVRKLFLAELIQLICAGIAFILLLVTNIPGVPDGLKTAAGVIALITTIATLIAFVLKLLGLKIGGEDNKLLNLGFWVVVVGLIVTLIDIIFSIANAPELAKQVCEITVNLSEVLVAYLIISGVSQIVAKAGDEKLAKIGRLIAILIAVIFATGVVLSALSMFITPADEVTKTALIVLSDVGSALGVIAYVFSFLYLFKANKLLNEKAN